MRESKMIDMTIKAVRGQDVAVMCSTFHESRVAFEDYCHWLTKRGVDFTAHKAANHQSVNVNGSVAAVRFVFSNHQLDGVQPDNVIIGG